ncbi:MAG: hypothetical protein NTV06_06555 [candidate division Zixibacteria bacterium]|nr:hypothetical protein [candidate division Zixibacteria bacterium]
MQEVKLLTQKDIIILITLAVLVFIGGYLSLGALFMNTSMGLLLPDWFFTIWGGLAILGLNILWVVIIFRFCPHGHIKLKTFLTTLVFALSVSLLLSSWVVKGFADAMH